MNNAAKFLIASVRQRERDWAVRLTRGVAFTRQELLEPWWAWTTWLAAGITIRRIQEAP